MARPKNKADLVKASNSGYEKLMKLIDSISIEERESDLCYGDFVGKEAHWSRDKNLRDVLVHLYEWHQLLLNWVDSNLRGEERQFLLEGYNWRTYGDMNVEFWRKHQGTSLEDSLKMLEESHKAVMNLLENFSDEELFEKNAYSWVGGSTLGSYFVSATASHYEWGFKKLNKSLKESRKK